MKFLCGLFFLCFFSKAFTQPPPYSNPTDNIVRAGTYFARFEEQHCYLKKRIPFRKVIVHDFRADTSKIGYVESINSKSVFSKIQLNQTWTNTINHYLEDNFEKESNLTLVLVLYDFWMQEGTFSDIKVGKDQKYVNDDYDIGATTITNIDAYILADSLTPFFRLNHTFISGEKFKAKNLDFAFTLPFDSIVKKISATDITNFLSKRKKIAPNKLIEAYTTKQKSLEYLPQNLSKAIYYTFEDFLYNKPVITDLKLKVGKYTDELYTLSNGVEELVVNYWGFTDGTDLFIKTGFNVYKAVRAQNSFEVYGSKHLRSYADNGNRTGFKTSMLKFKNRILQLNMTTGDFY